MAFSITMMVTQGTLEKCMSSYAIVDVKGGSLSVSEQLRTYPSPNLVIS